TGNLDSHNGEAVMKLLHELHQEGATICMVTHDPRFVQMAEREIRLFDGKVVAEEDLQKKEAGGWGGWSKTYANGAGSCAKARHSAWSQCSRCRSGSRPAWRFSPLWTRRC